MPTTDEDLPPVFPFDVQHDTQILCVSQPILNWLTNLFPAEQKAFIDQICSADTRPIQQSLFSRERGRNFWAMPTHQNGKGKPGLCPHKGVL